MFLYKSGFGIRLIDCIAKRNRKFLNFISGFVIAAGFMGMVVVIVLLVLSCYKMATMPEVIKTPPVVPLFPWIPFPGLPTLYFTYWIIAIFILAVIHEGSHGIFSRLHKIKIQSTGFGFLGPLPLAFVEPNEKELVKKENKAQLSIFAAGPVSNFACAAITILIISFIANPLYVSALKNSGIIVASVNESGPAYEAGVMEGDIIKINGASTIGEFIEMQIEIRPNQTVSIETGGKTINIVTEKHPLNESIGYMGIGLKPRLAGINKGFPYLSALLFWIFITNVFVGLFNLLPLPIVDGGRMFYVAMLSLTKSRKKAEKISKIAYLFSLFLFFLMFAIWIIRIL